MVVSKHHWFLLAAVIALTGVIFLTPALDARLALTIGFAVLAGFLLSSWVRWRERQSGVRSSGRDANGDRSSSEESSHVFALGKLFEATMSGMREGLLVVDHEMRVVASNPAAHRLFTLAEVNLNSQRLTELTRNPAIYGAFLDALGGKELSGVKVETHDPDRRVFDLRVVPLKGADGKSTQGAIGVFFDITRLERLERVRQEFLSNVSHELRTPLTAILAFVETLEMEANGNDENSQRFLAIIRKNATRMHNLIDDILELSAIEAGNVQVKAEVIELQPLVNDVIASLAARASTHQVVLDNKVDRGTTVFADARRLEQMLNNLVENAIKFSSEDGHVAIRYESAASQENSHENGVRDRIVVEDTGEGIPAQHLQRLFELFYRVDRARSRDLGGTGLGLAIVKHLARAHGGEVTVESKLGEGSRFTIELPRPADAYAASVR
jgi:two-component system phosphate regulon sensor histidine kinase PhoR